MTQWLIGLACLLTFFGNLGTVGSIAQFGSVGLMCAAAAYALVTSRVRQGPMTSNEWILYAVGLSSLIICLVNSESETTAVSCAFMVTMIAISLCARAVSLPQILDVGAYVVLGYILVSLAAERGSLMSILSVSITKNGLMRLTPLGNVPNLSGYLFGGGSILLARRAILTKSWIERLVMIGSVFMAILLVIASSARASLLAVGAAGLFAVSVEVGWKRLFSYRWVRNTTGLGILFALVLAGKIGGYLTAILELDSKARGVGSGGTGRTELWSRGIDALQESPINFIFGGGFRSSASDLLGFSTENSYITILLDSGIFLGSAAIVAFACAPYQALRLMRRDGGLDSPLLLLPSFFAFLLCESVFNRYLLAIGNPISLMSVVLLFGLGLAQARHKRALAVPVPRPVAPTPAGLPGPRQGTLK